MMIQKQLTHNEVNQDECKFPIYVVCDDIRSPENAGMIFRISEALGVQKIYFSNTSPKTTNIRLKRTARSTHQIVMHEYVKNLKTLLLELKKDEFTLLGLEITNSSKSIKKINFDSYPKIALVIGAERTGISSELLEILDECVHIPMHGKNSSMNVVNALAIALFEISQKLLK